MSSVSLCGGLLLGGLVSLAVGVQTCPGEARFAPSHACDQPGDFKVCAKLLAYPGGSTLQPWGSKDYFAWMKQPDPSAAVSMMRSQNGDHACISLWTFSTVTQQAGCANVHLNCEASDTSAMLSHYNAKGLASVAACLRQRCPAIVGSQPAVATPYPTMAPAARQALPTRPPRPLISQAAAAAAATPYPTMASAGFAADSGTDTNSNLPIMKPIIDINLPSASPGGSNGLHGGNLAPTSVQAAPPANFGGNRAPAPRAKIGLPSVIAGPTIGGNPAPAPAGLSVTAGKPVTHSPALSTMVLPKGLSISGAAAAPPVQNLGKASSGQAAAEGSLSPLVGGSISSGGAPPTPLVGGSIDSGGAPPTANFRAAPAPTPAPGYKAPPSESSSAPTQLLGAIGNIICLVLVCGVCGLGVFLYLQKNPDMKHKLGGVHPKVKEALDKLPSGRGGYGLENRMQQPGAYGGRGQDAYGGHQQGLFGGRQQDAYAGQQQDGHQQGQQQDRYGGHPPEGYPGHQYQEVEQHGAAGGGWGARSQQPGGSFHGAPGSYEAHGAPVSNTVSGGGYGPPPPQDSWNHAASNSPNRGGRNSPGRGEQNAPFDYKAYRNPAPGYE